MYGYDSSEAEAIFGSKNKQQSQTKKNQRKMENKTESSVNNVSIGGEGNTVTINNYNRDEAAIEALKDTLDSIKEMQDTIISNLQEINKSSKTKTSRK